MNPPENTTPPAPYALTAKYRPGQEVWFRYPSIPPTKGIIIEVRVHHLWNEKGKIEVIEHYVAKASKTLNEERHELHPDWIRLTLDELMQSIKEDAEKANA